MKLKEGSTIRTQRGGHVKILKLLNQGAQGYVYKALYEGKREVAVKTYKPDAFKENRDVFLENLKKNIQHGTPSSTFIWPRDIFFVGKEFGYVMELVPSSFFPLSSYFYGSKRFASYSVRCRAALELAGAMAHIAGSFADLSPNNVFVHPKTGAVRIIDNDNVAPSGTSIGVIGTPSFIAPEVFVGKASPSKQTDSFSLAVLIFLLLVGEHPIQGNRYLSLRHLSDEEEHVLYGTNPLYIMDRNAANRPMRLQSNIGLTWVELPAYIREAFYSTFGSEEGMFRPERRVSAEAWQRLLLRLCSEVITCTSCGEELLSYRYPDPVCPGCKRRLRITRWLQLHDYRVPLRAGKVIYRGSFGYSQPEMALLPIVKVAGVDQLMNISGKKIRITRPNGSQLILQDGETITADPGLKIELSIGSATIVS